MSQSAPHHLIVTFSLGGTTTTVAQWIKQALEQAGHGAEIQDITFGPAKGGSVAPEAADCLWVLSPVYVHHPVPAITSFLDGLPHSDGRLAVPIVTYGGVCSGLALPDMGGALASKGYSLAGAAKVLAVHSMMWAYDEPIGKGRPDGSDQAQIEGLAGRVAAGLAAPDSFTPLDVAVLDYQPDHLRQIGQERNLESLKGMMPPVELDPDKCDECGICADNCFTHSITLDPKPVMADTCRLCLNCVRLCPRDALSTPVLGMMEGVLKDRAKEFGEPRETKVF